MKKLLFIFSVMIFAVIACGSKEEDEPKPIEPQIITDQEIDIEQEDNPQQDDEQITTSPGDIILYQGNNLCIYYGKNTWNFTRIAKIQDVGKEDLWDFLGDGEIEVKLEVK
jgi:hypothetical protein